MPLPVAASAHCPPITPGAALPITVRTRLLPLSTMYEELDEILTEPEWIDWFALTPLQRWAETETLWAHYLAIGGTLDPEPDTQSPFFDPDTPDPLSAHGGTGLYLLRRGGV
jgi:hypothetical protein